MLILTRRRNEKIIIGDQIEITVVAIQGEQVSLGIKAPREVPIHRKEVYEAIQAENRRAAQSVPGNWSRIWQLVKKGQRREDGGEEKG